MPTVDTAFTTPLEPDNFPDLLTAMQEHLELATSGQSHVFTTATWAAEADLYGIFVAALPPERRQHYDCRTCRAFVNRHGGLVVIEPTGHVMPIAWPIEFIDPVLGPAVAAVRRAVLRAQVDGVFLVAPGGAHEPDVLGTPRTPSCPSNADGWTHLALRLPLGLGRCNHHVLSADQRAAELREEFRMLRRGLSEFSAEVIQRACALLSAEALYRGEKILGVAQWLAALHKQLADIRDVRCRDNLIWRATASAPPGWCHVRSTMIGTLLADLAEGHSVDSARARFAAKMNPQQYQRPAAPPAAQTIDQAERLVERLGLASALARRYAKLEDVLHRALWTPPPAPPRETASGVFAHLRREATAPPATELPTRTLTWEKFRRDVLPHAIRIEHRIDAGPLPMMGALVTAVDPLSKPILQWDRETDRNTVSWYVHQYGHTAAMWNLQAHTWAEVTAVMLAPPHWGDVPFEHHTQAAWFLLRGCREAHASVGGGLFPECVRSELHGIRAVIEAHAKSTPIVGREEATACGLRLQRGIAWQHSTLRVTTRDNAITVIKLDRWD